MLTVIGAPCIQVTSGSAKSSIIGVNEFCWPYGSRPSLNTVSHHHIYGALELTRSVSCRWASLNAYGLQVVCINMVIGLRAGLLKRNFQKGHNVLISATKYL